MTQSQPEPQIGRIQGTVVSLIRNYRSRRQPFNPSCKLAPHGQASPNSDFDSWLFPATMVADRCGERLGLEEGGFVVHLALVLPESGVGAV
ncbi:unnamed protein product [Prunus brigantina]